MKIPMSVVTVFGGLFLLYAVCYIWALRKGVISLKEEQPGELDAQVWMWIFGAIGILTGLIAFGILLIFWIAKFG